MNFYEMQQAVYDDLNYSLSAPSPLVVTRVKRWLNEGHKHLLRLPGMTGLRQGSLSFNTVANQKSYGLAQAFDKLPDAITQESNNWRLQYRTRDWFRTVDPGQTDNGNPYVWIPDGLMPVLRHPDTSGSGLWAVSTNAGDTAQSVVLSGIRLSGDIDHAAPTTLTGTSRVAIGALTDYVTVLSFVVSSSTLGNIELYDAAAAGNLLARIPAGRTSVQYQAIRLWPTPAAVLSYRVDGQFAIDDLVADTDVPFLPTSYHDMLPVYARMRSYQKDGDNDRAAIAGQEWSSWTARLMMYQQFPPDYIPVPGRLGEGRIGWNDLGGAYPADWFL